MKKNVLIMSFSLIPSVILCGHSQMLHLQKYSDEIDYRFVLASKIKGKDISWADIIVFLRSESDVEKYITELCMGKKHMVYVLDDDLLNIPDYASSAKYYKLPSIRNNIETIIKNCDTFLTPSHVLYEKYGKWCKNRFLIDEPSLGYIEEKKENEVIKIGFAGSIDRTQDVNQILEAALVKIIEEYKDRVSVEFMGARPELVDKYNLKHIPYQMGYKKYTEIIGEANWDIGLAPMPVTKFHECKYFNKYVEYASYGIAGVYTNCVPYTYGIKDKENGLLVNNNPDEWYNSIVELIENKELRNNISKNCLKEAAEVYSLPVLSKDFLDKVLYGYKEIERQTIKGLWKFRVKSAFSRLGVKIKEHKWFFPIWVIGKIYRIVTGIDDANLGISNLTDITKDL